MRVAAAMPVIPLQRVGGIRFAAFDTTASGSNPKPPQHEDVHSDPGIGINPKWGKTKFIQKDSGRFAGRLLLGTLLSRLCDNFPRGGAMCRTNRAHHCVSAVRKLALLSVSYVALAAAGA